MKPVPSEAKMNRAEAKEPHSGHKAPAPAAGVGNERKAATEKAQVGQPTDGMRGAVAELHSQHPHAHDDHGPHHGGTEHVRHKPYHMS